MNLGFEGLCKTDEKYLCAAIDALSYSEEIDDATLIRRIYALTLSAYARLDDLCGTPRELLDAVAAGESEALSEMTVSSTDCGCVLTSGEIFVGDILAFEADAESGILIYDGEKFVSPSGSSVEGYKNARRSALLRPSRYLKTLPLEDTVTDGLSEAQIALLATAEAYFMRGFRCQYDDSRFTRVGGGEFRWQIGLREPEDYTTDRWGYINCAAFTYELYRVALGFDLGSLYTTFNLMSEYSKNGFVENKPMYPFFYAPNPNADEVEKKKIEESFFAKLEVGDLVVVRRSTGTGHVMMYIGGGRLAHSSGASYKYDDSYETHEPTVMVLKVWEYLFESTAPNYIFKDDGYITQLGIVRPLDKFSGEIPENTRNRVKNMRGIFAEKLSSVKGYASVCEGDEITYTFKVKNLGKEVREVSISDSLPHGTAYSSGELDFDGERLFATLSLAPRAEAQISYTVRVTDGEIGKIRDTGATVCGVKHSTGDIIVRNSLSDGEKAAISASAASLVSDESASVFGFGLANAIYSGAGVKAPFDSVNPADIERELFVVEEFFVLREESKYVAMIPDGLFGGRALQTQNLYSATCKKSSARVRLLREHDLLAGDMIIVKNTGDVELYLYTGDAIFNLTEKKECEKPYKGFLESLIAARHYFVVLRA